MNNRFRIFGALLYSVPCLLDISVAAEPAPAIAVTREHGTCEDSVIGAAAIVPILDCNFFKTTVTSYHWWIVGEKSGKLEDTTDQTIDPDDLLRVEHTAQCSSTHQGKHLMEYCDAVATADGVKMMIWGGLPAFDSDLTVAIDAKRNFTCSFNAVYPAQTNHLRWKVTKKVLKLKSTKLEAGTRIYGWISVEFDEIDGKTAETHSYKVEGFFKPVIQSTPRDTTSNEGEQAGAGQPATQPADKVPVKDQPSTPTPKDAPR
jgi:hypothetical protein